MSKGWPEEIEKAQSEPMVKIGGKLWKRLPYGSKSSNGVSAASPCHDCRVTDGQLHVFGCDVETCPACGEKLITCGCEE